MKNNKKSFMNVEELAEHLSVSKPTVYRLIESRKIAFYKIRGSIRFKMKDVDEYLEKNRVESMF